MIIDKAPSIFLRQAGKYLNAHLFDKDIMGLAMSPKLGGAAGHLLGQKSIRLYDTSIYCRDDSGYSADARGWHQVHCEVTQITNEIIHAAITHTGMFSFILGSWQCSFGHENRWFSHILVPLDKYIQKRLISEVCQALSC
jgi:hypothetical protein